jgi:hypothetical protein
MHDFTKTGNRPRRLLLFILLCTISFLAGMLIMGGRFVLSGRSLFRDSGQDNIFALDRLIAMPEKELESVDIAQMNLVCSEDLPGSETLDIRQCLATLDQWADIIRKDTDNRLPSFQANPKKYNNSVNLFKVVNMVLCLKEQIGVDYNQEIMRRTEFPDSKDVFIHGCITGKKEGGCVSIPTLCVSVGRRLGYPLKLVLTREHVFFRWDDGREVFNMEACCPGCDTHPDEYYRSWPRPLSEQEVKDNHFLMSLTAAEELGLFLEMRGHCLFDTGRLAEAQVMYANAYRLMPAQVRLGHMDRVIREELRKISTQVKTDSVRRNDHDTKIQ